MKQGFFTVKSNVPIAKSVYRMELEGDTSAITAAGQFVNIRLDGLYLRRPISVCDRGEGSLTIIYKVVGAGTEKMSAMSGGERLDVLSGLGNGYDTSKSGSAPLLIGGGVGVPPLYGLAKQLAKNTGIDKMSAQAVGGAVGHNPISIIVPCHRVVGTNGSLTGYAGGLDKKIALLELEKADTARFFRPKKGTAL